MCKQIILFVNFIMERFPLDPLHSLWLFVDQNGVSRGFLLSLKMTGSLNHFPLASLNVSTRKKTLQTLATGTVQFCLLYSAMSAVSFTVKSSDSYRYLKGLGLVQFDINYRYYTIHILPTSFQEVNLHHCSLILIELDTTIASSMILNFQELHNLLKL